MEESLGKETPLGYFHFQINQDRDTKELPFLGKHFILLLPIFVVCILLSSLVRFFGLWWWLFLFCDDHLARRDYSDRIQTTSKSIVIGWLTDLALTGDWSTSNPNFEVDLEFESFVLWRVTLVACLPPLHHTIDELRGRPAV